VEMVMIGVGRLRRLLPKIGPYVVMAIVLPGGTLIALLAYLYARRDAKATMPVAMSRAADLLKRVRPHLLWNRSP
jgi:hypothetical protein